MEYEKIKQLIDDMGDSKLSSIDISFPDGTKISMKKEINKSIVSTNISNEENINNDIEEFIESDSKREETYGNLKIIKSPMVGTFYQKPSPTSEPYVKIGKEVSKGETVCIIEAMKLMNEIESEFDGKIVEIYVKDGETVEYGTKLFAIK